MTASNAAGEGAGATAPDGTPTRAREGAAEGRSDGPPNPPQAPAAAGATDTAALTATEARRRERQLGEAAARALHAVFVQRLSATRMASFEDPGANAKNDPSWVLGRYWYSIAAAESLVPTLHVLEVVLRNAMYDALAAHLTGGVGVDLPDCWLDWPAHQSVLYQDAQRPWADHLVKVAKAKRDILTDKRVLDTGRLIAELNLGFWTGLLSDHYEKRSAQQVWPTCLRQVFPNLPASEDRPRLAEHFKHIRRLRNRAFHHEPLWRRRPAEDHRMLCETIGWIDAEMAEWARGLSTAKVTQERGVGYFEGMARKHALARPALAAAATSLLGATTVVPMTPPAAGTGG